MEFIFSYWYMFFACVMIAILAMSSGISGATFFVPFVLIVLRIPVASAIAIGIFVEVFGFAAGVYSYARLKMINFRLARKIIFSSVLFVILGVILTHIMRPTIIEYIFILALMIIATQLLLNKDTPRSKAKPFDATSGIVAAIGGFLEGFISGGMGESNQYNLFVRLKRTPGEATGTSVFIVAITAIVATVTQLYFFLHNNAFGSISPYIMLIVYSVLGSLVGAKFGSILATRVDRIKYKKFISALLYLVAGVSLIKVIFMPI